MSTRAIAAAADARREWSQWPWEDRAAVFLRAGELLATSHRDTLNAATMLGQSKTAFQAEIDAAGELIDFWRFNPHYAEELYHEQPISHAGCGAWNQLGLPAARRVRLRGHTFNFTSIAGNLPTAPALMGNTVVWKPASSAMLSAYYLMRLFEAAGLPPGVINFVPGDPDAISDVVLRHRDLAGVHFTGSTAVFNTMWKTDWQQHGALSVLPADRRRDRRQGLHRRARVRRRAGARVAIVRGAFEYQGQKCSAASRVYIPTSLWPDVRDRVVAHDGRDPAWATSCDFRNFMGAVIDAARVHKISGYLAEAKRSGTIVHGGGAQDDVGYFIEPTLVETADPGARAPVRGDLRPGRDGVRLRRTRGGRRR